jgi:hypothetical protein
MSEVPDPLETELAALRPSPISPGLRHRVADGLSTWPGRRWLWGTGLASVLMAAGVVAVVAPWRKDPAPPVLPAVVPAPAPVEPESPDPSVLAYRRALARSPEDLDALLDKQATTNPNPMPVGTFTRSPASLDALLGVD